MILKKVLLFVCIAILFIPDSGFAQRKRGSQFAIIGDIGFTGGAGASMFRNAVMKKDNDLTFKKIAPAYSYGGLGSISFVGNKPAFFLFTVGGEFVQQTALPQLSDIDAAGDGSGLYNKTINYKTTDILILGKITYYFGLDAQKPVYMEGGMKLSTLSSVTENNNVENPGYYTNLGHYDPSVKYRDNYKSLVLGIGQYGDFVSFGLRCNYVLDDITNGTDFMVNDGVYDNVLINPNYTSKYAGYARTNLINIEMHLTLTLSFIKIGRASCGGYYKRLFTLSKDCEYYW